jgi:serine O-acetyltransferase
MPIQAGTWGAESPNTRGTVTDDRERRRCRAVGPDSAASDHLPTALSVPESGFSARVIWRTLLRDYRRYRATGARSALSVALTQGFWASAVFRLSHYALGRFTFPGLRVIVNALCLIFQKCVEVLTGISIPARCDIGPGLYIGHFGGIFIDERCRLGENCNIAQGVTIGKGGRGELQGEPTLGDRVHVGTGAIILGKISIGNDAVIGPGAVVMVSVPPCGVALGNPARVIGLDGSFDFVRYDGMENDPARKLALQSQTSSAHTHKK